MATAFAYIILIALLLVLLLYTISLLNSLVTHVPQVGTFGKGKKLVTENIPQFIQPGKTFLDLGSGTGKITRFFEKHSKVEATGYEFDLGNYLIAKFLNLVFQTKCQYYRKNFFRIKDFSQYDYIYIYSFPGMMRKIEKEIVPKLQTGTLLIVNTFPFENLTPKHTFSDGKEGPKVFVYEIS